MRGSLTVSMLLLGACTAANQQTPSAPSDAEQAGAQCDAGAIQDLIGKPADAFADDAKARSGAAAVRRYVTGSPVTMDFRADRLNVETDPTGTIVKLSCG